MKFNCLQENLSKGLSIVSKAIPLKSSMPVLTNVLLVAKDGRLKLVGSDLATTISLYVGASVDADGHIAVPSKILGSFVSNLSSDTLALELKGPILHISTETANSKINCVPAGDYPELPNLAIEKAHLEIDPKDFSDLISSVAFSAAIEGSRPVLEGIYLYYADGNLHAVTADGFRLSEKVHTMSNKVEPFGVIIPAKTLMDVTRIFGSSNENIKIALNSEENMVIFESEGTHIAVRIIQGDFPDYKKLIPEETSLSAEFDAQDFSEAVKLTSLFAKENDSVVSIEFNPEGYVVLESYSQESGEHSSKFDAKVEGDLLKVSFNSRFLLDFLNTVKSERIIFTSNGNLTPGIIRGVDNDTYIHILMPVRIQN